AALPCCIHAPEPICPKLKSDKLRGLGRSPSFLPEKQDVTPLLCRDRRGVLNERLAEIMGLVSGRSSRPEGAITAMEISRVKKESSPDSGLLFSAYFRLFRSIRSDERETAVKSTTKCKEGQQAVSPKTA
ncbi:MAG: hypothetical protein ABFD92_14865, partial [Planctomycetaceae bacterium]